MKGGRRSSGYDQQDSGPGKFKDERKWPDWEPAFMNYLSTIPGSYHVPLSYVVREQEDLDHDRDFGTIFSLK